MKKALAASLLLASVATPLLAKQAPTISGGVMYLNLDVVLGYQDNRLPGDWEHFFNEASEHMFAATNGNIQFGTINLYNNNTSVVEDVMILDNTGGASATTGGYLAIDYRQNPVTFGVVNWVGSGVAGGRVTLFEQSLMNAGPAVLTHELGHYVFGLLDLYEGWYFESLADYNAGAATTSRPYVTGSLGTYHVNDGLNNGDGTSHRSLVDCFEGSFWSIMSASRSNPISWVIDNENGGTQAFEFCDPGHYSYPASDKDLDSDGDDDYYFLEHSMAPAYHNESPWETIKRNLEAWDNTLLLTVPLAVDRSQPAGHTPIDFNYFSDKNSTVLVMDVSSSMYGANIETAVEAGKTLSSHFATQTRDGERIGLVAYNTNTTVPYSLTELNSTNRVTEVASFETALNGLPAIVQGRTSIGDGIDKMIAVIESIGKDGLQSAILISDGLQNEGSEPKDHYSDLLSKNIRVHTISVGGNADQVLMREIAEKTGGTFHHVNNISDLSSVFTEVYFQTSGDNSIEYLTQTLDDGQVVVTDFTMDRYSKEVTFVVSINGDLDLVELQLISPRGNLYTKANAPEGVLFYEGGLAKSVKMQSDLVEKGSWSIRIKNIGDAPLAMVVSGFSDDKENNVEFGIELIESKISMNDPIEIAAQLSYRGPLANVEMLAKVYDPSGNYIGTFDLYDNGQGGDKEAGDGLYYSDDFSSYTRSGTYKIEVTAKATAGKSHNAYQGTGQNLLETGIHYVTEDFERMRAANIIVGNPKVNEEVIEIGNCSLTKGATGANAVGTPFSVIAQPGDKIFVTDDGAEFATLITQHNSSAWWLGFWQYPYQGNGTANGSCSILRNSPHGESSFRCEGECLHHVEIGVNGVNQAVLNTTEAKWYKVDVAISGWQASEVSDRVIMVNGVEVTPGEWPLPESVNGTYYFYFGSGAKPWASWGVW